MLFNPACLHCAAAITFTPRVMKTFYAICAAASLLLAPAARATTPGTDAPTETARKATAREKVATATKAAKASKASSHRLRKFKSGLNYGVLVLLGLEKSNTVTSPAKRDWQLHVHQKHLQAKAKLVAKARRRRTAHLLG